ncbi:MAG TPA: type II secretion system protein [Candidatus Saccharimonadales bacterium]|nr:type II secretion system protein [Candidatus Saccharimonadales bacterium]
MWNTCRAFFRKTTALTHPRLLPVLSDCGFTLIEYLIVLSVFVIALSGIFIVLHPVEYVQKLADQQRKNDLTNVQQALSRYYHDFGKYPRYDKSSYEIIGPDNKPVAWGNKFANYMDALPLDPNSSKQYIYFAPDSSGQTYYLFANLDSSNDKDLCNKSNACNSVPKNVMCGDHFVCNYGISSSNVTP